MIWGKGQEFGESLQWTSAALMSVPQMAQPQCPALEALEAMAVICWKVRSWTSDLGDPGDSRSDSRRCWFRKVLCLGSSKRVVWRDATLDRLMVCWCLFIRNPLVFQCTGQAVWCSFGFPVLSFHAFAQYWDIAHTRLRHSLHGHRVRDFMDVRIWFLVMDASARVQQAWALCGAFLPYWRRKL